MTSTASYACPLCATSGDQWTHLYDLGGIAPVSVYRCECDARHHIHADGGLDTQSAREVRRANAAMADACDPFKGSEWR